MLCAYYIADIAVKCTSGSDHLAIHMARHQTATVYMCMWVCLKMGDSLNIWINIAILMKTMMIKHQMKSLFSSSFALLHTHACPLRCDAPDAH